MTNNTEAVVTKIEGIEIDAMNTEFYHAFNLINETNTPIVYITGRAGTGKTTFLKYLRVNTNKEMVVLAPTGVAAINAGGQTIHSFFKLPFSPFIPNDERLRGDKIDGIFKYDSTRKKTLKNLEVLVIDEISMVRCDILDVIDRLLLLLSNKTF